MIPQAFSQLIYHSPTRYAGGGIVGKRERGESNLLLNKNKLIIKNHPAVL